MSPEERQLIADLFERMRSVDTSDKDRQAESFINQNILTTDDAAYKLVQTVLVQEQALDDTQRRVEELEEEIRQMQAPAQRPAGGGGFLGGMFGGSKTAAGSVPSAGARSTGFGQAPQAQQPAGSPWSRQPAPQQGGYAQPAPQQAPAPQASSGGGFFRGALATAAGVAGGVMAAGAIRDMMGGGQAHASGSSGHGNSGSEEHSPYEVNQGSSGDAGHGYQSADDNDPGTDDDSSRWGGDDGSSL